MFAGKPIIVCYPRGTGGKFLINCLGFSDSSTLPDADLLLKQLDYKLTKQDKLSILLDKISKVKFVWNDLDFSCLTLLRFTIDEFGMNEIAHDIIRPLIEMLNSSPYKDCISNSGKLYCVESHSINETLSFYNSLDNAKIILFKENYNNFLEFRYANYYKKVKQQWEILRGVDWPTEAPTAIQEINQLPENIKKELSLMLSKNHYSHEWNVDELSDTSYLTWNADDFLSEDLFLSSLETLYQSLGLPDFAPNIIQPYHNAWVAKLEELEINNMNNQ
jgi:hypothetical protein